MSASYFSLSSPCSEKAQVGAQELHGCEVPA